MSEYCEQSLGLAWVVPVKITDLVASLQAHRGLKTGLHMLRCCHRYGQGDDAHLSKLPVELLDMVIHEVTKAKRRRVQRKWEKSFKCRRGVCSSIDHLTAADREDMLPSPDEFCCNSHYQDACDELIENEDLWDLGHDRHMEAVLDWERNTSERMFMYDARTGEAACKEGGFADLGRTLKSDFGLEAYISQQTVSKAMQQYSDESVVAFDEHPTTTVAYLKLPLIFGRTWIHGSHEGGAYFDSEYHFHGTSTLTTVLDPQSLVLSEAVQRRFERAMRLLQLRPFLHPTQLPISSSRQGVNTSDLQTGSLVDAASTPTAVAQLKEDLRALEASSWPKLLALAKTDVNVSVG